MSFSASTCLSYTGTTILTDPISIYTSSDVFITAVTLNQITNCPLVLTGIPDGTTTIRLRSANHYCCDITLTCNDLCTTCELAFDSYGDSNIIGRIVAGELTGSCENNITDYRINWYGPDSTTNVAFTSGFGTDFTPYNYTHPLTDNASIPALAGTYIPVVDKVKLNGLNYSQTGGTGFIQSNLDCFESVYVSAYTCDNGTEEGNYTHRINFSGASAGVMPLSINSTFELDPTTNYFAWKFKGESIPDSLKISYYGSAYSNNPIILDYWTVGQSSSRNFNLLILPKSESTSNYLLKVTSLTGLTRSPNDYLGLEVIPNQFNTQTKWDFYCTCLENFDCDLCLYDYLNTPYKIKASTITGITNACNVTTGSFSVSGCTLSSVSNSDIQKYLGNGGTQTGFVDVLTNNTTGLFNRPIPALFWSSISCGLSYYQVNYVPTCSLPNGNTIKFEKVNSGSFGQGVIKMEFSSLSDLNHYKSSYDSLFSSYSGTPTNPLDPNYYRYFTLFVPKNASPLTNCGDGTLSRAFNIHPSSTVTTGITGSNYTLEFTMPTISNQLPPFVCALNCELWMNFILNGINSSSTGTTNLENFTTNTGSKYVQPFGQAALFIQILGSSTAHTIGGGYFLNNSLNSTVPFSGNSSPYTQIPSLSALTCNNFTNKGILQGNLNNNWQAVGVYEYRVVLTDPSDVRSFDILARPIVNGVPFSAFSETAATVVGGTLTYTNPLYTF